MNERCIRIVFILLQHKGYLKISEIAKELKVSARSIRYDLDLIGDFLKDKALPPLIRKQGMGVSIKISDSDSKKLLDLLSGYNISYYALTKGERLKLILTYLLQCDGYTTIDALAEETKVSRGTISSDLKEIKQWLSVRNIRLLSVTNKGIILKGDEKVLRTTMIEILSSSLDLDKAMDIVESKSYYRFNPYLYKEIKRLFHDIDLEKIEGSVQRAEMLLNNTFSDDAYTNLVIHIAYAIKRIQEGKEIVASFKDMDKITNTKEFKVAKDLAKNLEKIYSIDISKEEIGYITIHLLGSGLNYYNDNIEENWLDTQILTKNIIEAVGNDLNVNLLNDSSLFKGFTDHLRPALYRITHDTNLKNPMLDEIKKEYNELFNIVSKNANIISNYIKKPVNESEIAYLTIHFRAALERQKKVNINRPNVLIVCSTGIGTSQMLLSSIKNRFKANVIGAVAFHKVEDILKSNTVDLIITTVPVEFNIKTILVNPLMTNADIKNIQKFIEELSFESDEVKGILNIVEKHCDIKEYETLKNDIETFLNFKKDKILKRRYEPMLKEVLNIKDIKLNVEAKDWRDAIRLGGALLQNKGAVEARYIDAMIESAEKNGPYIVIAPGIAMPHARPELGVNSIGMSLITLKNPIEFGNDKNDPVTLVICICAVDHSSHIKALSELMDILAEEENINIIKNAKSEEEVINLIKA
ncbi:BglG family transcription antiterminator [Clostridium algidicarnis]|uniref:BglG family transcription antiterminator n=1 Tax=Clostridium algidicarnis TaxID=37659 RepID=UPI001C0DADD1|nr:BglG family transcription antiterminator [Clostridium algidicarnis]MBU3209304.1 BglG family transcription antiterminator [Clostridium algidicarnis]